MRHEDQADGPTGRTSHITEGPSKRRGRIGGRYRQEAGRQDLSGTYIDRQDHAINLFELKFHSAPFALTQQQADEFLARKLRFQTATGVSKQVFFTLLTTFPLAAGAFNAGVDHAFDMNILFEGE